MGFFIRCKADIFQIAKKDGKTKTVGGFTVSTDKRQIMLTSLIALTRPGDNILTCTPIYDPYPNLVKTSGRNLIQTHLIEKDGHYEFDWHDFSEKLKQSKMFLFPSPHNPGGMVWSRETLEKVSHYCKLAGVIILSDEVHSDLTLPGKRYLPFFTLDEAVGSRSIVLTSISKSFNTAAIQGGIAIIKNDKLRHQFYGFLDNCYLADNVAFVKSEIEKHCPLISIVYGGASYLLFLNAKKMNLSDEKLSAFFVHEAKLGLSPSAQYGPGGEGHMRLNVGCPRSMLVEAMNRLKLAYQKWQDA